MDDDEIDRLSEFEKASRESLSTNHVTFFGLAEMRAYQRGEKVKRQRAGETKPRGKRVAVTPELREAILNETGSLNDVANRLGISTTTVFRVRRSAN